MFPKQFRVIDEKILEKVRGQGCCICGTHPVDPSHIRSRGAGGPDTLWNVVAHCRRHHTEWHSRGWKDFIRRNPTMAIVLTRLGWKWADGNLWHPGLEVKIVKGFEEPKAEMLTGSDFKGTPLKDAQIGPQGPEMDVESRRSRKNQKKTPTSSL